MYEPVHLKCFIYNPLPLFLCFTLFAFSYSLLTHCFGTKLISTLISAHNKCFSQFSSSQFAFPQNLFNYSFSLLSHFIPIVQLLNLLRFYCSPDWWIIKMFSTLKRFGFPVWKMLSDWVETLILTIIYTQAERTGKFTEKEALLPCGFLTSSERKFSTQRAFHS